MLARLASRGAPRQELEGVASELLLGSKLRTAAEYAEAMTAACTPRKLWRAAALALGEMRSHALEPTTAVYAAAMGSCGRGGWRFAFSLLADMRQQGLGPGGMLKMVIGVCERSDQWAQVLALLGEMERHGPEPGIAELGAAIRVCGRHGKRDQVARLVKVTDAKIYRSQLTDEDVLWERALDLLSEARQKRLGLDDRSYLATIEACSRGARWVEALVLVSELPKVGLLDKTTASSAAALGIEACALAGRWEQAAAFLTAIRKAGRKPWPESYKLVVSACAESGQWERALLLLREMGQSGTQLDADTYATVIHACGRAGEWKWAVSLIDEMDQAGLPPSAATFHVALRACLASGQLEWAEWLRAELRERGLEYAQSLAQQVAPQAADSSEQWIRALALLEKLPPGEPEATPAFEDALEACGRGARWDLVLALLAEMRGRALRVGERAYSAAIEACEEGGQNGASFALLNEMQDSGLQPEMDLYNAVLNSQAELPPLPLEQRRKAAKARPKPKPKPKRRAR